jgi:transposase, IS30 family
MKHYTHLSSEELALIEHLMRLAYSCTDIAKQLKRSYSTISREVKRTAELSRYDLKAAKVHRASKKAASRANSRRFALSDPIFDHIKALLIDQLSPAQALAKLRLKAARFGPVPRLPSCAALYRLTSPMGWYDRQRYPSMRLRRYYSKTELRLRRERAPNGWVSQCPSVEQRPEHLTKRTQSLYMEIDTIVGRKTDSARLVVAVCRRTRYTMIGWLKHCTAAAVVQWVRSRMYQQKLSFVGLIPDQGSEFARLPSIKSVTVYPCQPHRPWQKPTVENTNGLIRHYIPKGTLIRDLSQDFVTYVENQLNRRPRKCLDWKTPSELLYELHPRAVHFE